MLLTLRRNYEKCSQPDKQQKLFQKIPKMTMLPYVGGLPLIVLLLALHARAVLKKNKA